MIQKEIPIASISYTQCPYPSELYDSIKQKGILIAIKVNATDKGYECINGHKRLSAIADLNKEGNAITKVPCMIINDFSKAGSSYWGNTQNHH